MADKRQLYFGLLTDIKSRIQQAQVRAMLSVNAELIHLYWDIGKLIHQRQQQEGWGAAVIPRLAKDLHNELPEVKGFSERNIKRMLAFHRAYEDPAAFVPQLVAQTLPREKGPQPVAQITGTSLLWQIPWGHHALLLEKIKNIPTRRWYMEHTLRQGWSRNVLAMQIQGRAHARQGKAVSNFSGRLPSPQSDLVQQTLKDPYLFDFLTLEENFHERELETGLVKHLEKFLLELGQGFAFVGRQYHLEVGDEDFYIDLLFYHLRLRCYIVIELKTGPFKPEYAGKMTFYLSAVDDRLCHTDDQPSIGIILCTAKNRLIVEYALRDTQKPIGVSAYKLTQALPKKLKTKLPTVKELEKELGYGQ
jgi:predicted nuclease of restriction endonuclease-like (RecB) superfamily